MHLKNRFGAGYHIEIISQDGQSDAVKAKIAEMMPGTIPKVLLPLEF